MEIDNDVPMQDANEEPLDPTLDEDAISKGQEGPGSSGIADHKASKPLQLDSNNIGQLDQWIEHLGKCQVLSEEDVGKLALQNGR